MEKDLKQLTKSSTSAEIKQYFNAILKLSESNEDFPVNLDEVWPLVYAAKNKAVSALKENFMKGIDYQSLNQKVERELGATMKDEYFLSVPCLEFFIARKVRDVFEVYRQVFHKMAKQDENKDPMVMNANTLYNLRMKAVAWTAKMLNLSEESKLRMIQAVIGPLGLPSPNYVKSQGVMHSVTYLLKQRGNLVSVIQFNVMMLSNGYLEEKERPSKSKGISRFKCLTEKGLVYGENEVCPKNVLETQPHYYDDKFDELLTLLRVSSKKSTADKRGNSKEV